MAPNNLLSWNSLLCPPIGLCFNLLLLWLILRRTPKEMVPHSRVLLQTCLFDCLLLLQQFIGQNVIIFDANSHLAVIFFDGILLRLFPSAFHPVTLLALEMFWFVFSHLSIFGISVQFVYRYLMLNRNMNVTFGQYLLLLAGPAFFVGSMMIALTLDSLSTLNGQSIDPERYNNIINFEAQPIYVTVMLTDLRNLLYILVAFFYLISYLIILVTGWKMVRFVHNHTSFNPQLREMNRQLTRSLIILASFPLTLELLSIAMIGHMLLGEGGGGQAVLAFQFCLSLSCHWLPLLNPLATIFVNRPFREALLLIRGLVAMFRRMLGKRNAAGLIVPANLSNNAQSSNVAQ